VVATSPSLFLIVKTEFVNTLPLLLKMGAMVLITHGLLLLNDGLYFDAWLFDTHIENKNFALIYQWQRDHGRPLAGVYYIVNGLLFPSIFSQKIFIFTVLLTTTWLIFAICRQVQLPHSVALLISLFSLVFPAYQTYPDQSSNAQIVNQVQFYWAVYLVLAGSNWPRIIRHITLSISLFLFLMSFATESFLALYMPFLSLWLVYLLYMRHFSLFESMLHLIRFRLVFILLPILYYLIINIFFAPQGLYATYTDPTFSHLFSPLLWARFIKNAVLYPFVWGIDIVTQQLGLFAIITLISLSLFFNRYFFYATSTAQGSRVLPSYFKWLVILGVFTFMTGSAPYITGARIPPLHGYETRYSLMMALPMGLLLTSLWVFCIYRFPHHQKRLVGLICVVLSVFATAQISNYITWQAEWVKTRSWMENLKTIPIASEISIYRLNDQWSPLPNERNWQSFDRDQTLEFSVMLQRTLNSDKNPLGMTGNPLETQLTGIYQKIFFIDRYDNAGCQATLTIARSANAVNMSELRLALDYWYYQLIAPDALLRYLHSLSEVTVNLIKDNAATNCKIS